MAPLIVGSPDLLPPSSMPCRTPAKTRRGWSWPGSKGTAESGGPKHRTSVLNSSVAPPRPVPSGSRLLPRMPVMAPPKGSSADGELCVSTLKTNRRSRSTRTTPALSLNTFTSQLLPAASRRRATSSVLARM
jgi:hypothetical protein